MTLDRRRSGLLAVLSVAAVASAAVARRRHRRMRGAGRGASVPEQHVTCACGARYRSVGTGRHRVLWPAGETQDEALMSDECLACGRPLV